ncbi:MAG: DUF5916 domain-containing protein [Salinibacter sp.]
MGILLQSGPPCARALSAQSQAAIDTTRPALTHQLQAFRVDTPPELDGRLDEAVWAQADSATGFQQTRPSPGAPASHRTVARILYDDDHIYVGARMYDDPDSIAAQVLGRDEFGYTDRFIVSLGSYNNDRNAFRFRVGPAGSRVDGFLSSDTNEDISWDGVWTAKTHIDSLGWTVEIRIPLSQLRYAPIPKNETATWGLNFKRDIARRSESVSWAPLDPTVGRTVSLYGSLRGLRGLRASRNLEIRPYTVGRLERPATSTALRAPSEWSARLGGDVRYGLTPNVSLRATINPDFGQVEADPSQINLSAFETFFPEKRPFFIEGADIFEVQQAPRVFYSRRIGRRPQGAVPDSADVSQVPDRTSILGAAKLTGRTKGNWEVGVLDAVTAQEEATILDENGNRATPVVEPTTHYGVVRVRKNLRGGRSTVGGIVTATNRPGLESRLADEMHRAAYTGGLDGRHRFGDETYEVKGSLLASQVRGTPSALLQTQTSAAHYFQRPDAEHVSVDSTRTRLSGWSGGAALEKISGRWRWETSVRAESPGFEINDLGFFRRGDEIATEAGVSYLDAEEGDTFRRIRGTLFQRNEWSFGGEPTGRFLFYRLAATFQNNHSIEVDGQVRLSALSMTALRGGPALRENGSANVGLEYESDRRNALRVSLSADYQSRFGTEGYSSSLQPELRWRPTSRATVSLEPRLSVSRDASQYVESVSDDARTEYVFGTIRRRTLAVTTRASYRFSPEVTLRLYAQPFIGTGDYSAFSTVEQPAADAFADRFAPLGDHASFDAADDTYRVDDDRDPQTDYSFDDPDFTFQQLRSTVVFRWHYRRGSNLYLVWNRGRTVSRGVADFAPADGLGDLFRGGANTFAVKVDFWFGV